MEEVGCWNGSSGRASVRLSELKLQTPVQRKKKKNSEWRNWGAAQDFLTSEKTNMMEATCCWGPWSHRSVWPIWISYYLFLRSPRPQEVNLIKATFIIPPKVFCRIHFADICTDVAKATASETSGTLTQINKVVPNCTPYPHIVAV